VSQPSTIPRRKQIYNDHDVLIGRGKILYSNIGNLLLRKLATDRLSVYESAPFAEKQLVSDGMVRLIHEQGGLFLQQDEVGWVEVDEETAREKVSKHYSSWVLDDILGLYKDLTSLKKPTLSF